LHHHHYQNIYSLSFFLSLHSSDSPPYFLPDHHGVSCCL
jgi:hypothetical protein